MARITQPGNWAMILRKNIGDELVDEMNRQLVSKGSDDLDAHPVSYASDISVPTLIVQNENDPLGDLAAVQRMHDEISRNKDLIWISGENDRSFAYYYLTETPEILVDWFERTIGG